MEVVNFFFKAALPLRWEGGGRYMDIPFKANLLIIEYIEKLEIEKYIFHRVYLNIKKRICKIGIFFYLIFFREFREKRLGIEMVKDTVELSLQTGT